MTRLLALGALAKEELSAVLRQYGTVILWRFVAGCCLLAMVIVGLISLHRFLAETYGPYWADAALGAGFAVLAVLALVMAQAAEKKAKRRRLLAATLVTAAGVVEESLPNKKTVSGALALAALAGGFWLGRKR
ncbi:hypothetical protein J8I29_19355 [Labrys sp. LIt4]|uniref:hypothetical protein n=1 Tax=Labrys sp. LIt4 TaxID=2821355 RepID=UPI001ADFBA95|nr:hypothetical protein [Labrys sp. LIt4]MBP0581494.1 hypothetical protein [Labrys sp. LIt4]